MKHIKRSAAALYICVFAFSAMLLAGESASTAHNASSHDTTPRGKIVKLEGQVYVINKAGEKKRLTDTNYIVNSNETVVTDKGSKAVLQLDDGVLSVLGEKSSLRVEKTGWLSQLGGKVFYVFRKITGQGQSRRIRTNFATIGIRGTTFIIDVSDDKQFVALQEGKLNFKSPADDFEIHKTNMLAGEYTDFQQHDKAAQKALSTEYKNYKKKIDNEFIEYKKEFDLYANKVVSFNGLRVDETVLNKEWLLSFSEFSDFSREHIGEYREFKKQQGEQ
ncbi:hypothetical protein MNBD_GAMMA09-2945 [hydrothermal vent metagenome]|uniref:FecR protein domain-containing protein n=1 Tax=hydrothermal vent metagenome TaxID=652676 RepID=A0A3B0XC71_9ZZZZ